MKIWNKKNIDETPAQKKFHDALLFADIREECEKNKEV